LRVLFWGRSPVSCNDIFFWQAESFNQTQFRGAAQSFFRSSGISRPQILISRRRPLSAGANLTRQWWQR
jgi:hypothetical protein